MAVTTSNLIQGPADLYSGAFGAVEPADTNAAVSTPPLNTVWTDMGGTDGGVKLAVDQKYNPLVVDQIVDRPGSRLVQREFMIMTNLAEGTLANLSLSLNGGTLVPGVTTAASTFEPLYATAAIQPTYKAFILDGWAPGQFRRRVILRKGLSTNKVEQTYEKAKQTFIPVEFTGHYISSTISPMHIADQTA